MGLKSWELRRSSFNWGLAVRRLLKRLESYEQAIGQPVSGLRRYGALRPEVA